jgi:ribosome-binding ATPase
VRVHEDDQVPHPEGGVNPLDDLEAVETELLLADLEQAERRLERVARQAKSREREAMAEEAWLRELIAALGDGRPARSLPPPEDAPDALRALQPLTAKPVLYVVNVGEDGPFEPPPELTGRAVAAGARAIAISARLESELAELEPAEAAAMREELGVPEAGLERLARAAFELLDLISFFTADRGREARAHAVPRGTTAWEAAGKVHTDMQRGFVRAEVMPWDELVAAGGYAGARERGVLRLEGREYLVRDGEVVRVVFTP